jgi:WD40 repeat protein
VNPCPSLEHLRRLLDDALADGERPAVEEHLERCAACQQSLDELAAALAPAPPAAAAAPLDRWASTFLARLQNQPAPAPPTATFAAPPAAEPRLPAVPGYEVLGVLGRGGMGVVYQARHARLGRLVALKMIAGTAEPDAEYLARFRIEAEAVARMQHPNIIQVYDVGEVAHGPFLALELLEGGSLADRTRRTPQPPDEAARLTATLAAAVHYAHQRGVVHRDLKPSNVLLTASGTLKITDFGLAKRLDLAAAGAHVPTLTETGGVLGSPGYLAPEQAAAGTAPIGPAADVYALGAILYELLTGGPPFQGPTPMESVLRTLTEEPVPPSRLQPKTPRDLETICLQCLRKDPTRRYASAQDMADDLERWLRHEPIRARPVGRGERLLRWCQRQPALAALAAALALVTALGLAGVFWQWGQAVGARDAAERERDHAEREQAKAEQLAGALRDRNASMLWQTYRANIAGTAGALELNNVPTARILLEAAPKKYRGWEWQHLRSQLDGATRVLRGHTTGEYSTVPLSADGRRLTTIADDGSLHLWDVASGAEVPLEGRQEDFKFATFAPGGRWLVAHARDHTLHVFDATTGRGHAVLRGPGRAGHLFYRHSPDGRYVAAVFDQTTFRLWELPGARDCTPPAFRFSCAVGTFFFSADGRHFAYPGGKDFSLRIVETLTGKEVAVLRDPGDNTNAAAFSPDGTLVVTGADYPDHRVRLWRADTGKLIQVLGKHRNRVDWIGFSPDGSRVASSSLDQTAKLWDGRTGRFIAELRGHTGSVPRMTFSPDGRRLVSVSGDGTLRLWDTDRGALVGVLRGHEQAVYAAAFGSNGLLVSTATDGTVRQWDVGLVERNGVLGGHASYVYDVAWAPDGERLASVGWDGTARLWEATSGKQIGKPLPHDSTILESLAIAPDGAQLAVAEGRVGRLHVWDLAEGRRRFSWGLPTPIRSVSWCRGQPLLAAGTDSGQVHLWDVRTGKEQAALVAHQGPAFSVAFSPDGAQLASGGDDRVVRLWDARTRAPLAELPGHHGRVYRLAYSADGRLLAAASASSVHLWDVPARRLVKVLAHGSVVYGVAFSPDGTRLATGCRDNSIRLWDVASQEEVAELRGHTEYVHAVAFSPDGTRLASASGDETVRVWDTLPVQERAGR